MDRRRFIASSFGAAMLPMFFRRSLAPLALAPKRLLVLGGTNFLGPATVRALEVAGHSVSLFNRGVTNPQLFPLLEKLRGFRSPNADDQNLSALAGRRWDAVIDVWPSDPLTVELAATYLKDRTSHYLYVSSMAAYDASEFAKVGLTEDAALWPWNNNPGSYNRSKAESERRLHALIGDRLTIVRPGPIKGDRDTTPDLYAWLRRAQDGGRHIGPGDGRDHVQMVDVVDVGRFLALAADRGLFGTFNLTGRPMTFAEFIDNVKRAVRSTAEFVWVPQSSLHERGLDPDPGYLGKFPFWHPDPPHRGFFQISSQKAFDVGWKTRPFDETVFDYLAWLDQMDNFDWRDELTPAAEKSALDAWAARKA